MRTRHCLSNKAVEGEKKTEHNTSVYVLFLTIWILDAHRCRSLMNIKEITIVYFNNNNKIVSIQKN